MEGGSSVGKYGGAEVPTVSADSSRVQMINPLGLSAQDLPNRSPFFATNDEHCR
jgi:hypothetical protein